jgi:hypothetical protein
MTSFSPTRIVVRQEASETFHHLKGTTSPSPRRPPTPRRRSTEGASLGLSRNLGALFSRLGQPDRDRLLPAGHALAASAALQRASLSTVHGRLDGLPGPSTVSRHGTPSCLPPTRRPGFHGFVHARTSVWIVQCRCQSGWSGRVRSTHQDRGEGPVAQCPSKDGLGTPTGPSRCH